jgi:hypothetical protein
MQIAQGGKNIRNLMMKSNFTFDLRYPALEKTQSLQRIHGVHGALER